MLSFIVIVFSLIFLSVHVTGTFLQATWLPISYHTTTSDEIAGLVANLSAHGVQRVYVDVWNQGVVYFRSKTIQDLMGSNSTSQGRDVLLWTLQAGKLHNVEVVAWFEYGLMSAYQSAPNSFSTKVKQLGWELGLYNSFYWMNPSLSDVQGFLNGIIRDCLENYVDEGLLGVQLDDHFAYPVALGGTKTVMDNLMKSVHNTVQDCKANFPQSKILLSLAPSILSLSTDTYSVDWNSWGNQKLYDEVIPQLYRSDYKSYASIMSETWNSISSQTKTLFIASGIRVDGSGASTPEDDVNKMIDLSKTYSVGNSIWYCRGILETYPKSFPSEW